MKGILVIELRGFQALAGELAREAEGAGVTPDRIRASGISLLNSMLDQAEAVQKSIRRFHVGGDTWHLTFETVDLTIRFAQVFREIVFDHANRFGTFFLKPSMAINWGEPRYAGDRFIDDDSITAYRFADKGKSFRIRVVGAALEQLRRSKSWPFSEGEVAGIGAFAEIDAVAEASSSASRVTLPSLLVDSDIHYSDGTEDAVELLLKCQEGSRNILSFGGPVALNQPIYRNYLKRTIKQIEDDPGRKFTILSYVPMDEAVQSYGWIELCRRLSYKFSGRYAFAAFPIPKGQLRPFSYHVYDDRDVFLGLRSYSPQRGTATLSAGMIFRTQQVASRFREELHENYRKVGPIDDQKFAKLTGGMKGLSADQRRDINIDIETLLSENR